MNKKLITSGIAASLFAATGVASVASAQANATPPAFTTEQVTEIALAEVPGEVQETELEREYGVLVYEIEILTADGVEMEVEINADTGEILEVEAEDASDDDDDDDYSDDG
ncbi:PepSY domain-containing protein [Marivita sp.]|uniref:PepSY domain-containing protein n=1 Tax=Marivita sp. TaxID=2003365 RepID=UPI003F6D1B4D